MKKIVFLLVLCTFVVHTSTRTTTPTVNKKVELSVKNSEKLYNSDGCISNINVNLDNKSQTFCKDDIIKLKIEVIFNKPVQNINDTKIKAVGYKIEKITNWKRISLVKYECEIIVSITESDDNGRYYLFLNEFTEIISGRRNVMKMNYMIFMLQETNKIVTK